MKSLVTGATGLIGSHVVRALLGNGHQIKAFVRSAANLGAIPANDLELCYGDIMNIDSLNKAMAGCDIVFHTAGSFSYWGYNKDTFVHEAQQGMQNVVQAAANNNVEKIVFTSSSVTIGATEKSEVLSEDNPGNFDDAPAYVIAKVEQEKTAFESGNKYGVQIIAVCPTLTIGGPDYNLTESNRMIVNYLKDPYKSTWIGGCNLVSVDDVATAMLLLAEKGIAGERYIAGSDNLPWEEVHRKISELCGLPGPYVQAMRTSSYLISAFHELWHVFTNERPSSTREQARMVGKYYWYSSGKLAGLGYHPHSSENALIAAISWLVTSNHIPASLRASIQLSDKIYDYRKIQPV